MDGILKYAQITGACLYMGSDVNHSFKCAMIHPCKGLVVGKDENGLYKRNPTQAYIVEYEGNLLMAKEFAKRSGMMERYLEYHKHEFVPHSEYEGIHKIKDEFDLLLVNTKDMVALLKPATKRINPKAGTVGNYLHAALGTYETVTKYITSLVKLCTRNDIWSKEYASHVAQIAEYNREMLKAVEDYHDQYNLSPLSLLR